ncbi:hypothetical protein MRB53_018991 [Persea americana]|uniref:Uncharacterized protein n=1 Tax=Persea americana TaxID=3435 RepID=A0ACC2M932_PERAE|nr:hypothetical protein MRB53_018991 [Persea americana]
MLKSLPLAHLLWSTAISPFPRLLSGIVIQSNGVIAFQYPLIIVPRSRTSGGGGGPHGKFGVHVIDPPIFTLTNFSMNCPYQKDRSVRDNVRQRKGPSNPIQLSSICWSNSRGQGLCSPYTAFTPLLFIIHLTLSHNAELYDICPSMSNLKTPSMSNLVKGWGWGWCGVVHVESEDPVHVESCKEGVVGGCGVGVVHVESEDPKYSI